jgi:hypothetical protein
MPDSKRVERGNAIYDIRLSMNLWTVLELNELRWESEDFFLALMIPGSIGVDVLEVQGNFVGPWVYIV